MAHCPFCKGEVPKQLILHGGTCPNCFGEIPGEETPTDPGEAVKAQIHQEDLRQARARTRLPALIIAPVALFGIVGLWFAMRPPEVQPLVIDDLVIEFDVASYQAPEPTEAGKARPAPGSKAPKVAQGSNPQMGTRPTDGALSTPGMGVQAGDLAAGGAVDASGRRAVGGAAEVRSGGDLAPSELTGGSAAGGSEFGDLTAKVARTAALLVDEGDIKAAVRDMVSAYKGQLLQCHERVLKSDDTVGGTWTVQFTVGTDGRLKNVSAKGKGTASADLEACLVQRVSSWSIRGRLESERSTAFPVSFAAN